MEVTVLSHSLCAHWLTVLRDKNSPPPAVRKALGVISRLLFFEATRSAEVETTQVATPLEVTVGARLAERLVLVPIIRAGLVMVEPILELAPQASVMHIGARRNEETLETIPYYSSLGEGLASARAFILDPMVATGGTVAHAIAEVCRFSPKAVDVLAVVGAPEGIAQADKAASATKTPVRMWLATIDRELNERGYILPGIGDAGDRAFGTL